MSTRATYLFHPPAADPLGASVCFYVHWDGYPAGAAEYFRAAMLHPNRRGGLAAQFIRANELAEFTAAHDTHGDTEYRWTVRGDHLTGEHRPPDRESWETVWAGPLLALVNRHGGRLTKHAGTWHTVETLGAAIRGHLEEMEDHVERGRTGNACAASHEAWRALCRLCEAFPGDAPDLEAEARARIEKADGWLCQALNWKEAPGKPAVDRWRATFRHGEALEESTRRRLLTWTNGAGTMALDLPADHVAAVGQSGDNLPAVLDLVALPSVAAQLNALDPGDVRRELRDTGAWEGEELADEGENLRRLVWLAAWDLADHGDDEAAAEEGRP